MAYSDLNTEFENLFATSEWVAHGITTVPQNYQGEIGGNEFVRTGLYPGTGVINNFDGFSDRGFALISIFIDSGQGEQRAYVIADLLDDLLQGKTHGNTQFFKSTLTKIGIDSENPALWRVDYQITFARQ